MIRGWRNDPMWVEHYKKREQERLDLEVQRLKLEAQMMQSQREINRLVDNLRLGGIRI